ncbi:hypothetical protein ALCH109712_09115 [Alkalicoccus chagannorensis]
MLVLQKIYIRFVAADVFRGFYQCSVGLFGCLRIQL